MSEGDIQVILHRLDEVGRRLDQIHMEMDKRLELIYAEVRMTNGRVTELEKGDARMEGMETLRRRDRTVAVSVVSGGILAVLAWFVGQAV